jgi:hypothetical protein
MLIVGQWIRLPRKHHGIRYAELISQMLALTTVRAVAYDDKSSRLMLIVHTPKRP